jgi:hypothetical protein
MLEGVDRALHAPLYVLKISGLHGLSPRTFPFGFFLD